MKILVIGCHGQLGWELCNRGKNHGFQIISRDLPEFDICDHAASSEGVCQANFSLVINAAAYTAVDQAESEPEPAFAVNRDGPAYLADACAESKIPLIHMSTDYVFDGTKKDPYLETDPVSPLGVYGKSKAAGEKAVRARVPEHIIVRTSWLYGVHGNNFVKTMLRLGKKNEVLRVVADQYGCPTYAADLAETVFTMAAALRDGHEPAWGTYHYCGKGETSWHGFAEKIFDLARPYDEALVVKRVEPIPTSAYPTPAKRPANSVMSCSRLADAFGIRPPPWEQSLARAIKKIFTRQQSI